MASSGTASTTSRVEVPTWNGEVDKLSNYRFEVSTFVKSARGTDRYVCGPQLVRALGPRVRNAVGSCPKIDQVDVVDEKGRLTGWDTVFDYVLDKLDYTSLNDTGLLAEEFFPEDLEERWKDFPGGDYDFAKTYRALLTRFPAEALAGLDGKTMREKAMFNNGANEDEDETGGDTEELHEMVEQLVHLTDVEDCEEDEDTADQDWDNEVYAQFRQGGRSFKDARHLLRQVRVARGFYPVVVPTNELAVRAETGRDMAKMKCTLRRQFGRRARGCPNKNKLTVVGEPRGVDFDADREPSDADKNGVLVQFRKLEAFETFGNSWDQQ
ncbi:unnamed protein product [Prorocentrum cordatum]|uniref:Uncharacterized protein n=1 Tax=Prorocentrum cordatum TaxID=2364126 RepID=A0ABN9TTE1_9DINO|nr:unnamed protein product [Polarella glacialis]